MRIEILRTTVCGRERVEAGEVVEASDYDAHLLCSMGKARPYAEPEIPVIDPDLIETPRPRKKKPE